MKRSELLRSPEWWIANIQNELYSLIYSYMEDKKLKKKDIADKLKVSRGYVTQILDGNFDHKISKLVDVSLAFNKVPIIHYVDVDNFINNDANDKIYELVPMIRPREIVYSDAQNVINPKIPAVEYSPIESLNMAGGINSSPKEYKNFA